MFLIDSITGIPLKDRQEQTVALSFKDRGWAWKSSQGCQAWYSPDGNIQLYWEGSQGEHDKQRGWDWDDFPNHWTLIVCGMHILRNSLVECQALLERMQTTLNANVK